MQRKLLLLPLAAGILLVEGIIISARVRPATTTITGKLTAVYTDCGTRKRLGANGSIVTEPRAICDAGSSIEVYGTTIKTSSGLTSEKNYYDKHDPTLEPGMSVTVIYDSQNSLRCSTCRIIKR